MWKALPPIILGSLGAACDPIAHFGEAADSLVDPDESFLDDEPLRVLAGKFSDVRITGSDVDGGALVAREETPDGSHLRIAPFVLPSEGDDAALDSCDGGAITSFDTERYFAPGTTIVAFLDEDGDGFGVLRFVAPDCSERRESIDEVRLDSFDYVYDHDYEQGAVITGYAMQNRAGDVLRLDAETLDLETLALESSVFRNRNYGVFFEEGGQIHFFDEDLDDSFDVPRPFGSEVTRLVPDEHEGLYHTLLFEDETGLRSWRPGEEDELVAEEACHVHVGESFFTFRTSCESDDLVVVGAQVDLRQRVRIDDVEGVPVGGWLGSYSFHVVVGEGEWGTPGTLFEIEFSDEEWADGDAVVEEPEIEILAENALFWSPFRIENWSELGGTFVIPGGEEDARAEPVISPLTSGNFHYGLSNYRDGVVDVTFLGTYSGFEPKRIARDVAWPSVAGTAPWFWFEAGLRARFETELEAAFFVTDVENGAGLLRRAEFAGDSGDELVFGEPLAEEVSSDAPLVALERPAGAAYLTGRARRELRVHLLDAGLEQTIASGVTEFHAVRWPSPGLLHVVGQGDAAGIYFSKAR